MFPRSLKVEVGYHFSVRVVTELPIVELVRIFSLVIKPVGSLEFFLWDDTGPAWLVLYDVVDYKLRFSRLGCVIHVVRHVLWLLDRATELFSPVITSDSVRELTHCCFCSGPIFSLLIKVVSSWLILLILDSTSRELRSQFDRCTVHRCVHLLLFYVLHLRAHQTMVPS